jgi:hypothetical protein
MQGTSMEMMASYVTFYFGSLFGLDDRDDMFPRDVGYLFNGLHDVMLWKPELFITTAVRTSNPEIM